MVAQSSEVGYGRAPSTYSTWRAIPRPLLNDVVGAHQNRLWNRKPQCPCSLEVDHEFEDVRLLNGKIAGRLTLQELVDVVSASPIDGDKIGPVGN
jgi:hypothetical protein